MLDCKLVSNINDLGFLCNGFDREWLEPCCSDHKSMLVDFALSSLLSNFKHDYKTNQMYLRLFKKSIDLIRQHSLLLSRQQECEILDQILTLITCREEKTAYEGVDALEKYLRMHTSHCNECCQDDCEHLKFIQQRFVTNHSIRIKIKPAVMTCLLKFSRNWKPTSEQISEQYNALSNPVGRNQAVLFIITMLETFPSERNMHIPLLNKAISDSSTRVFAAIKERFLPNIFKKPELRSWFFECYDQICAQLDLFASLTICMLVTEHSTDDEIHWSQLINEHKLVFSLLHSDDSIRTMAFRLLCFHHKLATQIRFNDLKLVQAFVLINIPTSSPTMRTEMCTSLKKFLSRIVVNVQVRRKNGTLGQDLLDNFRNFLSAIHIHAVKSLLFDANFNRRVMALTLLGLLHTSGILTADGQDDQLYKLLGLLDLTKKPQFLEALLKNIEYSYDLVQMLALDLVQKIDFEIDSQAKNKFVKEVLKNADNISTGVQHCVAFQSKIIGVKFPDKVFDVLTEISSKCRQRIENASLNVITAEQPVHTLLNVASSLIPFISFSDSKQVQYLRKNIVELCMDITRVVDPVLQSLSPEGMLLTKEELASQSSDAQGDRHVPELIFEQNFESQTLLVGCWRTLKAVSSIFATVIELAPDELLLDEWKDLLPEFQRYFWTQLTMCRHRGVFELASKGFQIICDRYSKLFADDQQNSLSPFSWLKEILVAIRGGVDPQFLCSTRRSAGLPYLLVAILKSYQPNLINKLYCNVHLDRTLDTLFDCRSLDPIFEIHCVNVLKVLLQNTIYRKQVGKHLEKALLLTLNGLNSTHWSIRNSYSQLFSVLVMRIFGTDYFNKFGSGVTLLELSTLYPQAYEELLKLLSEFDPHRESTEQIVQPILVIFSHLRPSTLRTETKARELLAIIHLIAFNAKREKVRTLAVQSITSILHADTLFERYVDCYQRLIQNVDQLSTNALTSLFQLFGNTIEQIQDSANVSKMVGMFNLLFDNKFDVLSRNDYTVYHFLHTVKVAIDRGFSFDFRHLFMGSKLRDGQFSASGPLLSQLYTDFCRAENIPLPFDQLSNNFALHCLERVLLNNNNLDSIDVIALVTEAKRQQNYALIRRIVDLLASNDLVLLDKLISDGKFGDWMTEHELFLIHLNSNLLRNTRMNAEQWARLETIAQDCTPDIALKILELIEKVVRDGSMNEYIEKQVAFFLQNEDERIRDKAASIVSSNLCLQMENSLHSIACWTLEVKKYPELLETVMQLNEQDLSSDVGLSETYEIDEEKRIFEPIAKNTFVETFMLPEETDAIEFLLERIEQ